MEVGVVVGLVILVVVTVLAARRTDRARSAEVEAYQRAVEAACSHVQSLEERVKSYGGRVRCPACGWRPDGRPLWGCEGCGADFDTFVTRARCPRCPRAWEKTLCVRCRAFTPHVDWYVDEKLGP